MSSDGAEIVAQCFDRRQCSNAPLEFIWRVSEASREGRDALAVLDIDHEVPPVDDQRGGSVTARTEFKKFIEQRLDTYHVDRNHPERNGGSGLSPWLHFGHISSFEIVHEVLNSEGWNPMKITPPHNGRRAGWWGMSEGAEAFLDQVITWRELGFIYCFEHPDHTSYETLPEWAKNTLQEHANDERPLFTRSNNSKTAKRTIRCGMQHNGNSAKKA